ncbi:MAG: multidrug effflux MFS transporter [Proteobacteria bacterium]|nr:multidrug effflux MFS transporter [Pseudomonadota bacterium]
MKISHKTTSDKEFIFLAAAIMSLAALSIDAMLPALGQMAIDLNVLETNDIQLVIAMIFLGMSLGIMFYGPLSDAIGRKKTLYLGVSIFLIGVLVSIFASNLTTMLTGRLIQGFGVACCRVVSLAMVRDRFSGGDMGRIMSLIMMVFIIVPALAPTVGQTILLFAQWRIIFWFIFAYGMGSLLWLHFRQKETLHPEKLRSFSFANIISGIVETVKHPVSRGYTVASGLMFGAFVGYLSSSQQILQTQYMLGDLFALYFGVLALGYGLSSYANSRMIAIFGMEKLCFFALSFIISISFIFTLYLLLNSGEAGLNLFLLFIVLIFFCLGLLSSNFNTLAIQPFAHMAGTATSVISSIQTFLSVLIGGIVGQLYDGTVLPLVASYFVCSSLSMMIFLRIRNKSSSELVEPIN